MIFYIFREDEGGGCAVSDSTRTSSTDHALVSSGCQDPI